MITSRQNDQVKDLVRLRDRRVRRERGLFLIEGYRELRRAIDAGVELVTLYICPPLFLGENGPGLVEAAGAPVVELDEPVFRKASYRDRPEGLLATARHFDTGLARIDLLGSPLVLVAEAIEKPGNLGTMLRTADAAGARGVVVADPTTDPFNPNVVRASVGSLFTVPLAVADGDEVINWLAAAGVGTVATTPTGAAALWDLDLTGPVAIVVGSEQYGLSERWLAAAEHTAQIPMAGNADSLNAAMAAGVALFEAVRQRRIS